MDTQLIIILSVVAGILTPIIIYMNIDEIIGWFKNSFRKKIFVDPILAEKRLQVLKQQFSDIDKYFDEKASQKNSEARKRCEKTNSICPKCSSKNVNHRVKRVQGKVDGNIHGSSFLFSGSLSGSLHGEMDTNEVNKCNDCQNEWKIDDYKYTHSCDLMEESISRVYHYFYWIDRSKKVEFDKNNLSEKFSSYEEKRKFEMDKALNDSWLIREIKETWEKYPIELFEYLFKEHQKSSQNDFFNFYDPKLLENIGMKHIDEFINRRK